MPLFENKKRSFLGPKSYGEGDFNYLDRSGRSEAERVRTFLEKWLACFPSQHRSELEARLRDSNNRHFNSASFELILFACAKSLGYSVEVHPTLPNGNSKHPDFLLSRNGNDGFYLEAVLVSEFNDKEIAAQKRKDVVLETLEGIVSPNFFLVINIDGNLDTPPQSKKLKSDLENWLNKLDPDAVYSLNRKDADSLPAFRWNHSGCNITFEAIPKKPEARGKGQRIIGAQFGEAQWDNSWESLRNSIKSKGSRYGTLDKPILISVNVESMPIDRIDEMQALFGEEKFVFNRSNLGDQPRMRRKPNGAWQGPEGPQFSRISGAWIFHSTNCWNLASKSPIVYFNPWSSKPLPNELSMLKHARTEENKMIWKDGKIPKDILGLSDGWPGEY